MTLFGKLIFGALVVVIGGTLTYGFTSYLREDSATETITTTETTGSNSETNTSATVTSSTTADTKADGKKIAFSEFMKKGGSYKCSVTQNVASMTTKGTVYIHDSNIKANFAISVSGQNIETNMIARDGYTYSWTNANKSMGVKAKITTTGGNTNAGASGTYTWDGSQIGEYSCEAWAADDSIFTLPTDVKFMEPS